MGTYFYIVFYGARKREGDPRSTFRRRRSQAVGLCLLGLSVKPAILNTNSGVASVDNWRGEYSYICVQKP